jgi:hypothetical protein
MLRVQLRQVAAAALVVVAFGESTVAQYNGPTSLQQIRRQDVGTGYSVGSVNTNSLRQGQGSFGYSLPSLRRSGAPSSLGLRSGPVGKPFSSYSPSPTVSPYMNLFRDDNAFDDDFDYNTLVRPMLQQQQFNEQMQRQAIETGRRLQTLAAQADFRAQGSENQMPTGHKTVFNYLGHYYPQPRQQR